MVLARLRGSRAKTGTAGGRVQPGPADGFAGGVGFLRVAGDGGLGSGS